MADKISITICGDGGCGKSSITLRLVRSQWIHEYDPTIEDSYSVTRTVDGLPYFLSITDTAGQEEYRGLWTAATLQSDAFLLAYDITNPSSLDSLNYFMDMINHETERRAENAQCLRKELRGHNATDIGLPPPVKIVAGNKCDLKDGRVITSRDGLEYARKHGCGFMETSAREMVNIEETFALLVRRVVEARRLHYQQATAAPTRPPASRAGPSAHITTLPPTTADASMQGSHEVRTRHRFWGFGKRARNSVFVFNRSEQDLEKSKSDASTEEKGIEARGSFSSRLCCFG